MMLNSTISMGIAVVFSAALRKNFKNPSAVAPWRRAVHGPQFYARRSGGLGSGNSITEQLILRAVPAVAFVTQHC